MSPSDSWLLAFMYNCLLLNFVGLLEYGIVNYGMQVDGANKKAAEAMKKAMAEKQAKAEGSETGGVTVSGVRITPAGEGRPPPPIDGKRILIKMDGKVRFNHAGVAKFKDLDRTCMWLFPILFFVSSIILSILLHTDPRTAVSNSYKEQCPAYD